MHEANNAFERAKPLRAAGHLAESAYDQREQAGRTAEAQLLAAHDGLKVAEAEKGQIKAHRRLCGGERRAHISHRRQGEVELDAETPEIWLTAVRVEQPARLEVAGMGEVTGSVRLVSPEVDKLTRLGRVRIYLGDNGALRVGSFARSVIETAAGEGLALPLTAVLWNGRAAGAADPQQPGGNAQGQRRIGDRQHG